MKQAYSLVALVSLAVSSIAIPVEAREIPTKESACSSITICQNNNSSKCVLCTTCCINGGCDTYCSIL